jgi:hypothetical protein
VRRLRAALDEWMFRSFDASADDLGIYRIGFAAFALLTLVPVAPWLGDVPPILFRPPAGIPSLFSGFPAPGLLLAVNAVALTLLVLLGLGWRTPWVSLATTAVLLLLKSWEYGTGKINHDILLVMTPALLAGSGWGNARSLDAASRRYLSSGDGAAWSLALLGCFIGMAMGSAGGMKLISGWLDPATHATYGHLVVNNLGVGRGTWLASRLMLTDASVVWEVADWAATVLELSFVLAMFRQRWLRLALAAACLFHLGVWLLYDIVFAQNPVAYAAFMGYEPVRRRLGRWMDRPGWVIGATGVAAALGFAVGAPAERVLRLQLSEIVLVCAAVVGGVHLVRSVAGAMGARPTPRADAEAA